MSVPNNKLVSYMYMYLEKHGKIEITLWQKIIYTKIMISTTTYSISTGIRLVVFNFSGSMLNLFSNSHAL